MGFYKYLTDQIQKLILDLPIEHICDYGCGSGELLKCLSRVYPETTQFWGIDYFSRFNRMREQDPNAPVRLIDRESMDYQQLVDRPRFDLVISTCALHHYQYPVKELQNLISMIKPGGWLVVADISFTATSSGEVIKNISSFFDEIYRTFRGGYHRHHYFLPEALDLLESTKTKIIKSFETTYQETAEEASENTTHSKQLIEQKKGLLSQFSTVHQTALSGMLDLELSLVENHGISYQHLFFILAQKE